MSLFYSGQLRHWVRRSFPWLLAGALFSYLFVTSDWNEVLSALGRVHFFSFFFVLLCYFMVQFVADCLGTVYILRQFNLHVPLTRIFTARGITFLLAVVHYSIGQGALPLYLHRTQRLPLLTTSSAILFLVFIDFYWVVLLSFLGALGIARDASATLLTVAGYVLWIDLALFIFLVLQLIFWLVLVPRADAFIQPVQKVLVWVRQRPLCLAFRQANLNTYWRATLVRAPVHLSMLLFSFFALRTFTPEVPLRAFVFVYPLTLLIGTLPITPAGLGTTQVATVELLRDFASREVLLAFSTLWVLGILVLKVMLGAYFLRKRSLGSLN